MSDTSALAHLGWGPFFASSSDDALVPARVTLQGRDVWRVHDGTREHSVGVRGRLRLEPHALPVAGDWVLLGDGADVVERVLPRRTALVR